MVLLTNTIFDMEKHKIRVMVADGQPIFRNGLKYILKTMQQIRLVGEVAEGRKLIGLASRLIPDVILIDALLPGINNIEAIRELNRCVPNCKIIALSVHGHENKIASILQAGALGFLLKNTSSRELEEAILTVRQNKNYFHREIRNELMDIYTKCQAGDISSFRTFTKLERVIINLMCDALTSKEIARRLYISKRTVEGHRTRIMDKMGVRSIGGVITYAHVKGIYSSF